MRVLLVDDDARRATETSEALSAQGAASVVHVRRTAGLLEKVRRARPDVILIHTNSPDRDTLEHLCCVSRDNPRPIALFTHDDDPERIRAALRAGVSAYVVRGLDTARLRSVIEVAVARFEEYQAMKQALDESRRQLAQRKVVERAKGIVMKQRGISEDEAYRLLRRLAMDRGKPLSEVAQTIVTADELLSG